MSTLMLEWYKGQNSRKKMKHILKDLQNLTMWHGVCMCSCFNCNCTEHTHMEEGLHFTAYTMPFCNRMQPQGKKSRMHSVNKDCTCWAKNGFLQSPLENLL